MAEVESNSNKYQVAPGRYLVAANMGVGYEHLDTPEKAAQVIEFNFKWLIREASKQIAQRGITSEFDHQDIDSDTYRSQETAELEYFWLIGRRDRVDWILRRSQNV